MISIRSAIIMISTKSAIILSICILLNQLVISQTFEKLIATEYDEVAYDALALNDTSFIILSQHGNYNFYEYPYYTISKLNNSGDITDTKKIVIDSLYTIEFAQRIFLDSNENIVVAGRVRNFSTSSFMQYVGILDKNLNLLHDTITGNSQVSDAGTYYILNYKNNIISAGFTEYSGEHNVFISEYSVLGELLQRKEIDWDAYTASSILEIADENSIYLNGIYGNSGGILKLNNSNFEIIDTIDFSSSFLSFDSRRINNSDEFIVAGKRAQSGFYKLFIARLNFEGQIINENYYGPDDTNCFYGLNSLDMIDSNRLYLTGTFNFTALPPFLSPEQRWIFCNKLHIDGSIIWQRFYKGELNYMPYKVLSLNDGGALILSTKYDWNNPVPDQRDIHILRVDSTGWYEGLLIGITQYDQQKQILVYPNPVKTKVNFVFGLYQDLNISMFNLMGELVFSNEYKSAATIDISHFPAGTYIYKIIGENGFFEEGKLVKQ